MKKVTLNIQESKYNFFLELLKNLDFVQIEDSEGDTKKEIVRNLEKGFKDLKQYKQGKLKTTLAKDFLHEL
ncbi:hypothetical protein [Halpernia sp.]|uniref:hypothetical protein n=1 Tax=Halpernia sp. TaxID=2782209 RepID=UPI003A8FDD60